MEVMNSETRTGLIRQYRAIAAETGGGEALLLVPADFDKSNVDSIRYIFGGQKVRFESLGTAEWERKVAELLPGLEAKLMKVTYHVVPSFKPERTLEVAFDEARGTYRLWRSGVDGDEGHFEDIDDQGRIEHLMIALLKSSLPFNLGHVTGFDGTGYTLNVQQGFNNVSLSWWSGVADLPEAVLRLTELLDQWMGCQQGPRDLVSSARDGAVMPELK